MKQKINSIIPGIIVCLIISVISKIINIFVPEVGAATFAIIIGIIVGNTLIRDGKYSKGIKFSEKFFLSWAIALLGVILNINKVLSVGWNGFLFIILQMTLTIIVVYFIGKKLGFKEKFVLLMCAGNAVCGSSAIGATDEVINADKKDKSISIAMVNLIGTILMFILPLITLGLYNHSELKTSAMIGGILQSVGQVVASGALISPQISNMSTIFKIIRIIFLTVVVIVLGKMAERDERKNGETCDIKEEKMKVKIPWYIIVFFILAIICSLGIIPNTVNAEVHKVGEYFEVIALAAIGMNVKFKDLMEQGKKSIIYAGLIAISQIIIATGLIYLLF